MLFLVCNHVTSPGRGGGGTPYVGLYEEAPPERGIFSRLQVYERVGKSVIWVCEKAQKRGTFLFENGI